MGYTQLRIHPRNQTTRRQTGCGYSEFLVRMQIIANCNAPQLEMKVYFFHFVLYMSHKTNQRLDASPIKFIIIIPSCEVKLLQFALVSF
ncbi:unnamed protein product [Clavelina lepadiformis]|uniref:Uncharacterized protein n=1 Tax=Clavelina lepadiformis TaxID=159417 RepID=A0ABP0FY48_CLALP